MSQKSQRIGWYVNRILNTPPELICDVQPSRLPWKKSPFSKKFSEIEPADYVITYHSMLHAVTGVYKVTSQKQLGPCFIDKKNRFFYSIEQFGSQPLKLLGHFNFPRFCSLHKTSAVFSLITPVQNACRTDFVFVLTPEQFEFIHSSLEEPVYYDKENRIDSTAVESTSTLLDFYSSRATAFIGLFIASIFGVLSFLAIIPQVVLTPQNYWVSLLPYAGFCAICWYSWRKFAFYGQLAEKSKTFIQANFNSLQGIEIYDEEGKSDTLQKTLKSIEQKQNDLWMRKFVLNRKPIFYFLAILMIVILPLITFANFYPFKLFWENMTAIINSLINWLTITL